MCLNWKVPEEDARAAPKAAVALHMQASSDVHISYVCKTQVSRQHVWRGEVGNVGSCAEGLGFKIFQKGSVLSA